MAAIWLLTDAELVEALAQARRQMDLCAAELKRRHPAEVIRRNCPNCGGDVAIRNPTGTCDHLDYPENVRPSRRRPMFGEAGYWRNVCGVPPEEGSDDLPEWAILAAAEIVHASCQSGWNLVAARALVAARRAGREEMRERAARASEARVPEKSEHVAQEVAHDIRALPLDEDPRRRPRDMALAEFFARIGVERWTFKDTTKLDTIWSGPFTEAPRPIALIGAPAAEITTDRLLTENERNELREICQASLAFIPDYLDLTHF